MSRPRIAPMMIALLMLTGCATMQGLYVQDGPLFTSVESVPAGKALAYFYRVAEMQGGTRDLPIYLARYEEFTTREEVQDAMAEGGRLFVLHEDDYADVWGPNGYYDSSTGETMDADLLLVAFQAGRTIARVSDYYIPLMFNRSGGYYPVFVDPGEYLIFVAETPFALGSIQRYLDNGLTANLGLIADHVVVRMEPGEEYYLRGAFRGSYHLDLVPYSEGYHEIALCHLISEPDAKWPEGSGR